MCPYIICLVTENGKKIVICMERAPNLGEEIQVTNGNVYRGGCRGIPKFCPNKEILGSKWKILEGVETTNLMTFRVEEVK